MSPAKFLLLLVLACDVVSAGTLRRGLGPEPDSLDIHQAQGLAAIQVLRDVREGLLTFDAGGELAAGVAASWRIENGGRLYRFELRGDARWSDGQPVTADDFVRAWRRALAPATQARTAALLGSLANAQRVMRGEAEPAELGVRSDSPLELEVELESAAPWFLEVLAHPVSFPLPPGAAEQPPVNGPFHVVDAVPHAHIRLQRNPAFHSASTVRIEEVEWLPIEDPAAELARYRAGELDITETIPAGRYAWLLENLGDQLRVSPYLGSFWLGLNLRHAPLGNSLAVRRALALALDRETLVNVVLGAGERPGWSVVPPGITGYDPQMSEAHDWSREEREAQARGLYADAGYGPDNPLRLELRFNTSSQHRRMAVAVAAMWKQVLGVHTQLVHEEWKVFVNNRRQGVITQVFRGGWIADYADPASFLDLFRSGDALNTTFYANAEFDGLLDAAAGLAGAPRMRALERAEALLMRDMPIVPLYYYVSRHLVSPRVAGFRDNVRDVHLSRYLDVPGQDE